MCDCRQCAAKGYTYSEAWRRETECRMVAAMPSNGRRHAYLSKVLERRGEAAYKRLREDVWVLVQKAEPQPELFA